MSAVHKMGTKIKCQQCTVEVYSQRNLKQHVRSVHMKMVAEGSNTGKEMGDKEVQPLLQEQPNEDEGQEQEKEENSQEIED